MVFVPMLLIYITGFLSSSDQIFSYPFSSWILADFGIINFRIFTTFYSCFQILTLLGYIIFQKLLNFKLKHLGNTKNSSYRKEQDYNLFRKRILIINTFSFSLLYLIFTAVDFLPFMACYCLFSLLAGIYNISLTSFSIDFSRRLKNQSFFYLLLGTYFSLAQFTLKPLGILLTSSISVENLMIITSILTLISIIPLWYTKLPTQENSYNK
ncbi:MAG: hypothetical protein ACFFKA_20835 [Candidatus Thorarchaeota archaeon]